MWTSRFEIVVTVVLAGSIIGAGALLVNDRAWAQERSAKNAAPKPARAQNGEKLTALLEERRTFTKGQFESWKAEAIRLNDEAEEEQSKPGSSTARAGREEPGLPLYVFARNQLYLWARRLLTAELELRDKKADQVAAYEAHLLRMKELEGAFKKGANADKDALAEAKFHRLEAEIMLERAKAK